MSQYQPYSQRTPGGAQNQASNQLGQSRSQPTQPIQPTQPVYQSSTNYQS